MFALKIELKFKNAFKRRLIFVIFYWLECSLQGKLITFTKWLKTLDLECVNDFHLNKLRELIYLCCKAIQLHLVREHSLCLCSMFLETQKKKD